MSSKQKRKARHALLGLLVLCTGAAVATLTSELPENFPEEYLFQSLFTTEPCVSSELLERHVQFFSGSRALTVVTQERPSVDSDFVVTTEEFTVSYTIADVSAREGGDELYISGIKDDGTSIVERWRWAATEGRALAHAPSPTPDRGSPQGPFQYAVVPGGSSPLPPRRPPTKKILLEDPLSGPFMSIAVDPEGRFLLLYSTVNSSLYELDFAAGPPSLQAVYTPATLPEIAAVDTLHPLDHASLGRVYKASGRTDGIVYPDSQIVLLFDHDNDAFFDAHDAMLQAEYRASSYWHSPDFKFVWVD